MKTYRNNPFRAMLMLAGFLMGPLTKKATIAKAEQFDKFAKEHDNQPATRPRRRNKTSSPSQRQIRKARRRSHAAGFKNAFA